jgi:hypothetical protein
MTYAFSCIIDNFKILAENGMRNVELFVPSFRRTNKFLNAPISQG